MKKRCGWVHLDNPLYVKYHDEEWGIPVHDDRLLFETLILEGAQAGLSWVTVLNKRANYKALFDNFNVQKVSEYNESKILSLLQNPGIVRNKLKVRSAVKNAKVFIDIQKEFGSFDTYLWAFVDFKPVINHFKTLADVPGKTDLSDRISKDLKKRGMSFVGSTIIYAFLQSVGVVNDHEAGCWCRSE
ncbi:MAG: DNA-3-methyladenine glycosylase I [Alphaproteobacteria bacterium]|nr:DNA-3-methyladenine glycosylase I [Alphaproteobacteria bacterium]